MSMSLDSAYQFVENLAATTSIETIPSVKNDFKVVGNNKVLVAGNELSMSKASIKQLCKILKVPQSVYDHNFYVDDNDLWNNIVRHLQDKLNKDSEVAMHCDIEKNLIVSMSNKIEKYRYDYVDLLSILDKTKPDMIHTSKNAYGLHMSYNTDVELEFTSRIKDKDIFRLMNSIELYPFESAGARLNATLMRMVCTNLSYGRDRMFSQSISDSKNDDYAGDIIGAIELFKKEPINGVYEYYNSKINKMINTNASLEEVKNVNNVFSRVINSNSEHARLLDEYGMEFFSKDAKKVLPVEYLESKYEGIIGPDQQENKARTPICYYDMYNLITYEGTHSEILTESQKNELKMYAGSLLSKRLDFDLPPEIKTPDFSDFNLN